MAAPVSESYDLLVITDATWSMGTYLMSLNSSLQDIVRISATTACFDRVGVLAYRDYVADRRNLIEWSGWHTRDANSETSQDRLLSFVRSLRRHGGVDWPEATKTALAHAYELMRPNAKTIILLYADAPPHTKENSGHGMWEAEQRALLTPGAYGGTANLFADWTSAVTTLSCGEKRAQVFTIIDPGQSLTSTPTFFTYLSARTGGVCITVKYPSSTTISKLTVSILLAWMGVDKRGAIPESAQLATELRYKDVSGIDELESETDEKAARFLPLAAEAKDEATTLSGPTRRERLLDNLERSPLSLETLAQVIPRREHPVMDFAKRYKADPEYREFVRQQLAEMIQSDVTVIALNPVFGTLWRTVCSDRLNPARDALISEFGLQVDRIIDADKRELMKTWLEESYNMTGEITETIESVPAAARYPCVFLDPTLRFPADGGSNEEASMKFTRSELLEIGRSCDYRILRRLGSVLTRLTYVRSEEELPAHIADVPVKDVPRIPMALAQEAYGREFWKILLHTVLPGTMLAARPAALLAALSLRMGMKPLEDAAISELLAYRDYWNTLDIPETWNTNCLGLLLEADQRHQQYLASLQGGTAGQTILKAEDRRLFQALVDYKLLEMNLKTCLTAHIGWTPNNSRVPLGPVVVCKACEFPRSVTVMADSGVCGLCTVPKKDITTEGGRDALLRSNVSQADDSGTEGWWWECSMQDCRAQYVVYNPQNLKVRAKCHYCRQKGKISAQDADYHRLTTAPCVTCTVCANRVIWPEAYRPSDFDPAAYKCPACTSNRPNTIVLEETTPQKLIAENGTEWCLRNEAGTIREPLTERSLFYVISDAATSTTNGDARASFADKIQVLPVAEPALTIRGKPVHNARELVASLGEWISSRRVQQGTCTLCFSSKHKRRDLRPACGGRKGCREVICASCVDSWYGINRPGTVINVAALSCPFCRRQPVPNALPRQLRYLGGLRNAVADAGEWVYAWCVGCGFAKRFAERVCAAGMIGEGVEGWRCEECLTAQGQGKGVSGLVVKECPGCGVVTQKTAGCDHIACPNCEAHWCFNCGEKVGEREIYTHMSDKHGGWYGGREFEYYLILVNGY
ncbi:hypothetical protein N656DRAFT_840145 [Canariomyces notabilis]|uniref:RING-type domain-containing protein n=1 Tax=Canariomyces notabilis TaxID=2074819 RepID=A0AAN6QI44_9PEZI|nr:hypothetical protein N656DRAFT_840145 [Canariomyces arenarius]